MHIYKWQQNGLLYLVLWELSHIKEGNLFIYIIVRYEFLDISNRISVRLRNVMFKQILQRDFYKQN